MSSRGRPILTTNLLCLCHIAPCEHCPTRPFTTPGEAPRDGIQDTSGVVVTFLCSTGGYLR